jgi:ribonuclease P/MRP protein subunit POP1
MVRIKMLGRGAPDDLANIYRVDNAEAKKWIKGKGKKRDDVEMNEVNTFFLVDIVFVG